MVGYLGNFCACCLKAGQVAHNWDEVDVAHPSKELEPLSDQVHEELKARVLQGESHAHDDSTDHVTDGSGQDGVEVHLGVASLG